VTVLGLGREGLDLARYLAGEGATVRVSDSQPAERLPGLAELADLDLAFSLGGHPPDEVLAADLLFVSPGIDPRTPILVEARRRGLPLSSATELFLSRCPAPIVGITGSSGKSTTTALVGEMLRAAGYDTVVGGNIGRPLVGQLPSLRADQVVVMELSSFQLEPLDRSPGLATITNITPNHLDRHATMGEYITAKEQIFRHQRPDDYTVLNADDPISQALYPPGRVVHFSLERSVYGAYLAGETLRLELAATAEICRADQIVLRGRHNLANALTASVTAALAGAPVEAMRAVLTSFSGLPHRLEKVGELDGVAFYDDSIATAPERSIAALLAFPEPVVLLAGGRDKHLPMREWAELIRQRCPRVVLFGEAAGLIRAALDEVGYPGERIRSAETIEAAAQAGYELAEPGQAVLLSPGCTSYDMFRDFVERGRAFARAVGELTGERP
jgi:UDP-N-acetylmuramoylalanine--D-glutamate ligase